MERELPAIQPGMLFANVLDGIRALFAFRARLGFGEVFFDRSFDFEKYRFNFYGSFKYNGSCVLLL